MRRRDMPSTSVVQVRVKQDALGDHGQRGPKETNPDPSTRSQRGSIVHPRLGGGIIMIAMQRGEGEGGGVHLGFDLRSPRPFSLLSVGPFLALAAIRTTTDSSCAPGRSRSLLSRTNHWPGPIARLTVSFSTLLLCREGRERGQESLKQDLSCRNQLAVWIDELSKIPSN